MSRIREVLEALEEGKKQFNEIMSRETVSIFKVDEIYGETCAKAEDIHNVLAWGDNLEYMEFLLKERDMAGKLQLIYVDPPFFSNSKYQASVRLKSEKLGTSPVIKTGAYDDRWEDSMMQYLQMIAVRLYLMRELLSHRGCIWVHLDWHCSHYVKLMLDEIFGESNFVNEVAWTYKSGGASKRSFAKKHDTLLFYGKTKEYKFNPLKEKSYNRGFKPYRFKGVEEFQDELGWYTMVNMKDVWNIDMVGRTSKERTGYATQKPEKLIARIIEACSDEGDICADFFSGSGTLGAVATMENRRWIMCDEGDVSTVSQIKRLCKNSESSFKVMRCMDKVDVGSVIFSDELGCLKLENYKPDTFRLNPTDVEVAAQYIGDDGISSVSFWSVDSNYDGRIHRGETLVGGQDFYPLPEGEFNVVGYDVFGNRFQWERKR